MADLSAELVARVAERAADALRQENGNVKRAAERLGISRGKLRRLIEKYGIAKPGRRPANA